MNTLVKLETMAEYDELMKYFKALSTADKTNQMREMCRGDLFFLIRYVFGREDIERQWLFERCREVQESPNGHLDLWAREHYKSTIITYAKTIQDVLASHGEEPLEEWNGREVTVGIFSHTRPIAKGFLRQIMREFENNEDLKYLFPDILYEDPKGEAPKWSEDDGIVLKRKSNPKESTIEAHGLVDGQPTSKHFYIMVYDDVVTLSSIGTPEMMNKTTVAWENSLNLGVRGGHKRYAGTRYHFNDSYKVIIARGAGKVRLHPATKNGKVDGEPVLLTREELEEKRREQGPYTFGCQMLQDPKADSVQGFKEEWMKFYKGTLTGQGMNIFIVVDPANEKKKRSDYTSMWVIGRAVDGHDYILDGVRDRLSLTERTAKLFELHRQWKQPQKKLIAGYEKYGKDADIEHIKSKMKDESYHFDIVALGGSMSKNDRIRRIIPDFEQGNIYFPEHLEYVTYEGKVIDLVKVFINDEYIPFPVAEHDDMLDALARKKDMNIKYPTSKPIIHSVPTLNRFGYSGR